MSDPNTPSITETAAPQGVTINLAEVGQRYLGAFQRLFDIAAFQLEGVRQVTERTYDEFAKSIRFLPSQRDHRGFDGAKEEAERWLLRHLLGDALSQVVPLLEDARSICALAQWKAAGSQGGRTGVEAILDAERKSFLALDLAEKFTHLQRTHSVTTPFSPHAQALVKLGNCLALRRGIVSEKDATGAAELVVTLAVVQAAPQPGEAAQAKAQIAELQRKFSVGETVRLEKSDYLHAISTLTLFASTLIRSVQECVKQAQA